MVVGKPYVHFKINNEPMEDVLDYNHTWATTVETNKGPINKPVLVNSAAQAQKIFNIDMGPYFAQGASSLIIVRVAGSSVNRIPTKGVFNFNTEEEIHFGIAEQYVVKKTVNGTQYEHEIYYVEVNGAFKAVIRYKDSNGNIVPDLFIDSWFDDGRIITQEDKESDGDAIAKARTGSEAVDTTAPDYDPASYSDLVVSQIYNINEVKPVLIPKHYVIPKGTSLIKLQTLYEGDYDITVSCAESYTVEQPGYYNIYITEPSLGTISIRDAFDLEKIVARINNAGFNVEASLTEDGAVVNATMHTDTTSISLGTLNMNDNSTQSFITTDIDKNTFISLAQSNADATQITFLTDTELQNILADEANKNVTGYTNVATSSILPYKINFANAGSQLLSGGSNGEWDGVHQRIASDYQAQAHKEGLKALQRVRVAGIFCMYGEDLIQREYIYHGENPIEPEKGMNNNETCKWRTILLGANENDRTDISSLVQKASTLNNQYILFLGQGLIDTGYTGVASTMSELQKTQYGITSDYMLLPYECTQYVAGVRAKLEYYESIFGGQGRKRIRSIGSLDIAPLSSYETEYEWNPSQYITLNESGVLTFTEEYGNITLTDGVTTMQEHNEEDEEGVMNILKYAQNAIYDVCLPYIGQNINADLENSINMAIESVLTSMKRDDQSLVDTDEYNAYTVSISLGTRSNQLLGRIYIYLTITPVHALRQIEVEMTVQ